MDLLHLVSKGELMRLLSIFLFVLVLGACSDEPSAIEPTKPSVIEPIADDSSTVAYWLDDNVESKADLAKAREALDPDGYRELVKALIKKQPLYIGMLPLEERADDELGLLAVSEDGLTLGYIPLEERSDEICDAAVKEDPRAFGSTPEEYRTLERCLDAVSRDTSSSKSIHRWQVPEELKYTPEMRELGFKPPGECCISVAPPIE